MGILALLGVTWMLGVPGSADGQTPDTSRLEATSLYTAGMAAAGAERWTDALHSFRAAYQLSRAPAALFNVGYALRALGRTREARDVFQELVEEPQPGLHQALRTQATALLTEMQETLSWLRLDGPLPPGTRVVIDGLSRPVDSPRVEIDAGRHALELNAPGYLPFRWQGEVESGQERVISVAMSALTPTAPAVMAPALLNLPIPEPAAQPREEGPSFWESPILWTAVTVAGVAALALGLGFGLAPEQPATQSSRVYSL